MGRTADGITQLIERMLRAKRQIELAVIEIKTGAGTSTFSGLSTGRSHTPDPTAIQAIKNAAELDCVVLDNGFKVISPERWLRVYDVVKSFCAPDAVDREIFRRRYDRGDNSVPYTIEQSVYSRHLLKIRNHAKMCAAQEQLVRFF